MAFPFFEPRSVAFLALLSLSAVTPAIFSQSVAVNQADMARAQAPTIADLAPTGEINGRAIPSPNDADLGEQDIMQRSQAYRPFTASIALPFYFTSNVALSEHNEMSDWVEAPVAAFSYQPRLSSSLYGVMTVREQLFYYDEFTGLNFGAFDVEAGLIYLMPRLHNLVLRGEFLYERLTEKNSFESFFSDYSFLLSAEMPFRLGRAQQLYVGVDTKLTFDADPEQPRRNDYEGYVGYTLALTRQFFLDATGRLAVRQYQLTDRVDVNEIFSCNLRCDFTQYVSASVISTFAANQSNGENFDYKVANVGGLLSLNIRF